MACANKAEALIAKGDDDSLRYACLELRMAIEHLFYDMIPVYAEELPTDIAKRWQPKQIIDALIDCDPHIEGGGSIEIMDKQGGTIAAFEFKGVTKRLIRDYWHKLGSYLHASVTENTTDWNNTVPFLMKTMSALREYSNERALVKHGEFLHFNCTCGRKIRRKVDALKFNPRIICPDVECAQIWKAADDDYKRVAIAMTWFVCAKCEAVNDIEERLRADGNLLTCKSCGIKYRASRQLVLEAQET